MPPKKGKRPRASPTTDEGLAIASLPAVVAANTPNEAALLFWVSEAVKSTTSSAATVPAPVEREVARGEVPLSTSQGEAEQVVEATASGKQQCSSSNSSSPDSPPAETPGEQGISAPKGLQQTASSSALAGIMVRDIVPFFDDLLQGQLGPVAIDVHILGQASLLRNPADFQRVLESHEHASSGPLQMLLASVRPFFFTRGSGFYTMDTSVYPVLPTLSLLLKAPHARKIMANATLLYRLLFLFLGTDRVDIANVVDVVSWSTVLRQGGTTSAIQRQPLLPAAPSDSLVMATDMLNALPLDTRTLLAAQASSIVSHDDTISTTATLLALTAAEEEEKRRAAASSNHDNPPQTREEDGGLTPPLRAVTAASSLPEIPSSAQVEQEEANTTVEQVLTALDHENAVHRRRAGTSSASPSARGKDSSRSLRSTFTDLGSAFFYYDRLLQPLENVGVATTDGTSGPHPIGTKVRVVADICADRAYAAFLCVLMSFHGVFVSRDRYMRLSDHLTEQAAELCEVAQAAVDAIHATDTRAEKITVRPESTATEMRNYVGRVLQNHAALRRSVSFPAPASSSSLMAQRDSIYALQRSLIACGAAEGEEAHLTQAERTVVKLCVRLLEAWLAMQERIEYRNGPLDKLFRNLGGHLRVSVVASAAAAEQAEEGEEVAPTPVVAYSVHPVWSVHAQSTGRIFCSAPNLQTIPKEPPMARHSYTALMNSQVQYEPSAPSTEKEPLFASHPEWTLRHLYVAPVGCVLVSLDFNQIELRVLAHLSRDPKLIASLSDETADVLSEVAKLVFSLGPTDDVAAEKRQAMKVIVYGLIYGMGHELLDERLRKIYPPQAADDAARDGQRKPPSARELTTALYGAYPFIQGYLRTSRTRAALDGQTETLCGVKDLSDEPDMNRRKQRAVAWAVQGGAADILHAAMRAVQRQRHELLPYFPAAPIALLMTVHDELIYAVPSGAVGVVVPKLKAIVESQGGQLGLRVPLRVSVKVGPSLGELAPYPP